MANIKIAFVGYYFGPKLGIGVYIDQLMSRLKIEHGTIEHIVFYTNENTKNNLGDLDPKVKVVESSWLNAGSIPAIFFTALIFPFICLFKKVAVAVLLSNPIVLSRFLPTVSVIQDLNEFEMRSKYGAIRTFYRKHIMLRSAVQNSTHLIASSRYAAGQIAKFFPAVAKNKIHVIELGVELVPVTSNTIDRTLAEYGLAEQRYFMVVGRIDPRAKSLYEAVSLYRHLTSNNGTGKQKLVLVGGINESSRVEAEEFLSFVKEDNWLSSNVQYLGFISDQALAGLYARATAVIFLSKNEGFGFPLIEAFSMGCPVIYNQSCQVLDEHSEGAGIAVTENEISNGFDHDRFKILYDQKERENLASKMNEIAARYSWEKCATEYLELLNSISGGRK